MLNRKESKLTNGATHQRRQNERPAPVKANRRRFIISPKAPSGPGAVAPKNGNGNGNGSDKPSPTDQAKASYASSHGTPAPGAPSPALDLSETIKSLVQLAREHGHVTYDDI